MCDESLSTALAGQETDAALVAAPDAQGLSAWQNKRIVADPRPDSPDCYRPRGTFGPAGRATAGVTRTGPATRTTANGGN